MGKQLTDAEIIAGVQAARGLIAVAARKLGVERKTLYNRAQKSEAIREAIEDAREFTTDTAEAALFKAISDGEAWAVCFYLKTQGKGRGYIEKQQFEHAGPGGGPLDVTVTRTIVRPGGEG